MKKILIVEDEAVIALDIQEMLVSLGFDVVATVNNGEDAIRKSVELSPDIVMMDIVLAGSIDGVEAAGRIRDLVDIPIVYLTSNAGHATIQRARATEPYGYVMKPADLQNLFSTIDTALHRYDLEQKLRLSEDRYRGIFAAIPDIVFVLSEDGLFSDLSVNSIQMLNASPETFVGKKVADVFPRETADIITEMIQNAKKTEVPQTREITVSVVGSLHIYEARLVKCGDKSYLAILRDISDRKYAERNLRVSELRYRSLVDTASVSIIIHSKGLILFVNNAAVKTFGARIPEDLVGRSIASFAHPEDRAAVIERIGSHPPVGSVIHQTDERYITLDGREIILRITGGMIDYNDMPSSLLFGIDVTGQAGIDKKLIKRHMHMSGILERTGFMVYDCEFPSGRLQVRGLVELITGYSLEEFESFNAKDLSALIHQEDSAKVPELIHRISDLNEFFQYRYRIKLKDGGYAFVEDTGFIAREKDGKEYRIIGAIRRVGF